MERKRRMALSCLKQQNRRMSTAVRGASHTACILGANGWFYRVVDNTVTNERCSRNGGQIQWKLEYRRQKVAQPTHFLLTDRCKTIANMLMSLMIMAALMIDILRQQNAHQ